MDSHTHGKVLPPGGLDTKVDITDATFTIFE